MQELRVLLETTQPINDEIRSAWFALPIDEEELQERLGVDIESEDYRILEKELPFADDVGEDTTIERLNDMYRTYESLPADLKEDYDELMCYFSNLDELHQHRNDIIHYSWCKNMTDVAHHLLDNDPAFSSVEERITRYFDFEAYGDYLDNNGNFLETEHGIYEMP
ncbi:conjugative transposon protein [Clostridioides difficile]|nr:conjugative transposon protein [Clostridioides difficile]